MKHKHLFLPLTVAILLSLSPVTSMACIPEPAPVPVVPPPPPVVPNVPSIIPAVQIGANTINVTQFKTGDPGTKAVAQDPPAAEPDKAAETAAPPENGELAPKSPRN
jgi:hypothetical protein